MITLGIEGTAHSIGVGIVNDKNGKCQVLSNQIKTYVPEKGGIHPREAANHHTIYIADLINESVKHAQINFSEIDLISFSQGPGLGPCLRTAATAARALSLSLNKPIIGVNHCVAHLEIGKGTIEGCTDPVLLYVSGANTQVIAYESGKYRIFGETLDMGVGTMLYCDRRRCTQRRNRWKLSSVRHGWTMPGHCSAIAIPIMSSRTCRTIWPGACARQRRAGSSGW